MSAHHIPSTADLQSIADRVWASYLDPDGANPLVLTAQAGAAEVTAAISVTGAWRGHVVVTFSAAAARHVAAALLGLTADEVTISDITDAVGEIVNIIGGNVKSLMPEPSALSLPHVLTGTGHVHWPAVTEVCRLNGRWLDEPVTVTVLESTADYVGATS